MDSLGFGSRDEWFDSSFAGWINEWNYTFDCRSWEIVKTTMTRNERTNVSLPNSNRTRIKPVLPTALTSTTARTRNF